MGGFFSTLKNVIRDTVVDFLYFPVWWYSRGLLKQIKGAGGSVIARQDALAIDIWIKNIGKPMYGQYDLVGRLISFFMRLFQIFVRTCALIVWTALMVVWLVVWLIIPIAVVYFIFFQARNFI